jgi:hypothetical protein
MKAIFWAGLDGRPFLLLIRAFEFRFSDRRRWFPRSRFFPILTGGFPWLGVSAHVLHDDRYAPVRRIQRILQIAQALVRKAPHLRNLIAAQSRLLHQSPSRVRAVGRKFPVAVAALAAERLGIGVSLDRNVIGNLSQFRRQQRHQLLPAPVERRTPAVEKRSFC